MLSEVIDTAESDSVESMTLWSQKVTFYDSNPFGPSKFKGLKRICVEVQRFEDISWLFLA